MSLDSVFLKIKRNEKITTKPKFICVHILLLFQKPQQNYLWTMTNIKHSSHQQYLTSTLVFFLFLCKIFFTTPTVKIFYRFLFSTRVAPKPCRCTDIICEPCLASNFLNMLPIFITCFIILRHIPL